MRALAVSYIKEREASALFVLDVCALHCPRSEQMTSQVLKEDMNSILECAIVMDVKTWG